MFIISVRIITLNVHGVVVISAGKPDISLKKIVLIILIQPWVLSDVRLFYCWFSPSSVFVQVEVFEGEKLQQNVENHIEEPK